MKPEERAEILIYDWLITKNKKIKKIYFNRTNAINAPTFHTKGLNKKPDFLIEFFEYGKQNFIAVEIKVGDDYKTVVDGKKIIDYYKNYVEKKTIYYIDNKEIKINHFALATQNSPKGYLFTDDGEIVDNSICKDKHRNNCVEWGMLPRYEYQRTMDLVRSLWSEFRRLRVDLGKGQFPSIGVLMSSPKISECPYYLCMTYNGEKRIWKQRFWEL